MRILVTGATGFVGSRLARRLIDDGFEVRCLTRDPSSEEARALDRAGAELSTVDLTGDHGLADALDGIEVAYFLVHMIGAAEDYAAAERAAAKRFARAASGAGVSRVIYLGGLGERADSPHLASRAAVGEVLAAAGPPLTWFRAGMVIGPGSESYELLKGIAKRLRILPAPDWLENETQPIGDDDMVEYLRAALDVPESTGREVQVGADVVTHLELVNEMAAALGESPPAQIRMTRRIARPASIAAGAAAVTHGNEEVARELGLGLDQPTVVTDPSGAELSTCARGRWPTY
jgi:uncharacterized protein YbjT (DUF2867 family)